MEQCKRLSAWGGAIVGLGLAASTTTAAVIPPNAGATVDGDIGEWNLSTDFAGDIQRPNPTGTVEGKLFLRYDRPAAVLYALILSEDGRNIITTGDNPGDTPGEETWLKLNDSNALRVDADDDNNGTPPDFAWYDLDTGADRASGWEGSLGVAPGTYTLSMHSNFFSNLGGDPDEDPESQTGRLTLDLQLPGPGDPNTNPIPTPAAFAAGGMLLVGLLGRRRIAG